MNSFPPLSYLGVLVISSLLGLFCFVFSFRLVVITTLILLCARGIEVILQLHMRDLFFSPFSHGFVFVCVSEIWIFIDPKEVCKGGVGVGIHHVGYEICPTICHKFQKAYP